MKIKSLQKSAANPLDADDYELLLRMAYILCSKFLISATSEGDDDKALRIYLLRDEYMDKYP